MKEARMVVRIALCAGIACVGGGGLCAGSVSDQSQVEKWVLPGKAADDAAQRAELAHALERAGAPIAKLADDDLDWGMAELDRVFTDVAPDGVLWVRGRDYKASFDANGLTFIPFLGSDAPRNYPVSFRFESLSVDGRMFAVRSSPDDGVAQSLPPEFDEAGLDVRYEFAFGPDHWPVMEVYSLAPTGIEQKFFFAERPQLDSVAGPVGEPGLSLYIAVETDLSAAETPESLRFSNERGHVDYTHAVLIDAAGRHTPLLTRLDAGSDRIVIDIPAEVLDAQVFPVVVDPVISTFSISLAFPTLNPDVAYDMATDRYIVVAERPFSAIDGDIWTELRTATGALVGGSGDWIDLTGFDWRRPRVANNRIASQFLVVAQVGTEAPRNIWGRTRQATGALGSQFAIIENTFDKINPDVGGDPHPNPPTYYMVVWQRVWNPTDHDIQGSMVTTAGAVHTLPGGTVTILIDNTAAHDRFPAISKSNGNPPSTTQQWTIVWQRTAGLFNEDIWGAQVHWNGTITHPPFPIAVSSSLDARPAVSSLLDDPLPGSPGARPYLVTFQRGLVNRTVQGRVMQGTSLITSANLTALEGQGVGQDHADSHVDSDGRTFIVAYSELFGTSSTDYDVYAASFCLDGETLVCTEAYENLAATFRPERQARVVAKRSGGATSNRSMVVWTRQEEGSDPNLVSGAVYQSVSCCVGDLTGDGSVGVADLLALLACWGPLGPSPGACESADLTGSGSVGVADLLVLLSAWGPCP